MDLQPIFMELQHRLDPMGGSASILDDRAVAFSWNHMTGLVVLLPDRTFALKVSTPWGDSDEKMVERAEEVPEEGINLLKTFWPKRGVDFSA